MSPEQVSGKTVDKRSDLWALGVVLLEMLTGRPVFEGETVSHVFAAVLTKEPDWNALPAKTPAPIRKLLRRCMEKDRRWRIADASDARLEIDEALTLFPCWSADGKELYYIGPDGQMMAAPIASAGAGFDPGAPIKLFQTRILGGGQDNGQNRQYDVSRDGRFLINTILGDAVSPITLLQNWHPEPGK
jgi:serine/threonine protein kinase